MTTKNFLSKISYCLIFIFSFFLSSNTQAQDSSIFELETTKTNRNLKLDRDDFYELAFKLLPTIYLENNAIKNIYEPEKASIKLKIEVNGIDSFTKLNNLGEKSKKIELIYITLNKYSDLNTVLDLTNLKGFNKLKYVYVKCCFKSNSSDIKKFLKINPNSKVRIFYKTETPS